MSVIQPADHHATFAGWATNKPRSQNADKPWSSRKRAAFFVLSATMCWVLLISPFFLFR